MIARFVEALITLFLASVVVFLMIHLVPGDPAQAILGEKATPEAMEAINARLGLNDPLPIQFGNYLARLAHGDFGESIRSGQPIISELTSRIPATLELAVLSLFLAVIFGILLGIFAARHPGGITDLLLGAFSVLGLSIPIFFLGLLLILVFGLWLEWFPLSGRVSYQVFYEPYTGFLILDSILFQNWEVLRSGLHHLILPSVALATIPTSLIARLTRSSMLETLRADYIRTARAKGKKEKNIFFRDALRNALLPVTTMIGFQFGLLLGGAILTENVFAWPGMGRWIVFSVEGRDYPAVQAAVLCFATGIIIVMAFTDMLLKRIDPRLRRTTS